MANLDKVNQGARIVDLQEGEDLKETGQGKARHLGGPGHGDGSGANKGERQAGAHLRPFGQVNYCDHHDQLRRLWHVGLVFPETT